MIPHEIYNCAYSGISGCLCKVRQSIPLKHFQMEFPQKSPSWFLDNHLNQTFIFRFHATFPAVYHRTRSYDGPFNFLCFKRPTGCSFGQQIPPRGNLLNSFGICAFCCVCFLYVVPTIPGGNCFAILSNQGFRISMVAFCCVFFRSNTPFFSSWWLKQPLWRNMLVNIPKMLQTKPPASSTP